MHIAENMSHTHEVIKPFPMTFLCATIWRMMIRWGYRRMPYRPLPSILINDVNGRQCFSQFNTCIPVEKCFTLCTTGHFGYWSIRNTHIDECHTWSIDSMQKCMKTTTTTTATSMAELFTAHQRLFLPFNQMCDLVPCFPLFHPTYSRRPFLLSRSPFTFTWNFIRSHNAMF